jgi:plasmid stabilization system protein ParE
VTRHVVVRREARMEAADAARWYKARSPAVARRFRHVIRDAIRLVAEHPEAFPLVRPSIRRLLTKEFPYAIFFAVESGVIIVLAILHQARHPERWPK